MAVAVLVVGIVEPVDERATAACLTHLAEVLDLRPGCPLTVGPPAASTADAHGPIPWT
jgi:hypothetical protein